MTVKITVEAREVLAKLSKMELQCRNLTGLMRNFGEYMKGSIEKNFTAGGRPTWPPLKLGSKMSWHSKRSTWKTKSGGFTKSGAAAWGGRIPLTDTGRLRRSISYQASANSMSIGTNVKYAAIHQFGGKIPPIYPKTKKALYWPGAEYPVKRTRGAHIPARPFLLFQTEDLVYFSKSAAKYLIGV